MEKTNETQQPEENVYPQYPHADRILELMLKPPEQRDSKAQNEIATLLMPLAREIANKTSYKAKDPLYIDAVECESAITMKMVEAIQNSQIDKNISSRTIIGYFATLGKRAVVDLQRETYGREYTNNTKKPAGRTFSLEAMFPDEGTNASDIIPSLQDHANNPLNILISRETPNSMPSAVIKKLQKILTPKQFEVVNLEIKRDPDTTTQEKAAQEIGMSQLTYSCHLSTATDRIRLNRDKLAAAHYDGQRTR